MYQALTRTMLIAGVVVLPGCDPLYTLGVRTQMSPAPAASCIETALRASPQRDVYRAPGKDGASGYMIGVTGASGGHWDLALNVERGRDSTQLLTVQTWWLGTATYRPLADQRQMVTEGAALLTELRAACAPASAEPIQCFTRGFGGSPACYPPA